MRYAVFLKPYSAVIRQSSSAGNRTLESVMTSELKSIDGAEYKFVKEVSLLDMISILERLVVLLRLWGRWERGRPGEVHILQGLAALRKGTQIVKVREIRELWPVTCPRRHVLFAVDALGDYTFSGGWLDEHPDHENWALWHVKAACNLLHREGCHVFKAVFQDHVAKV